jgi:branched-chain amino acid transport system ATP-binding protein
VAGNPSDLTLKVEDLHLSFGKVKALEEVNLVVRRGEILSLIGPNGAGKTSLLNCISGVYHPQRGKIFFERKDITKMPNYSRTGIGRTFQGIQLFLGMSTLSNIMSGRHIHMKTNFWQV